MSTMKKEDLIKIPEVIEEVKRHLWCESEKAGHDVGYEWALEDWVKRYSQAWLDYHMPDKKIENLKQEKNSQRITIVKKRRAKSYR